ncbi:MAG: DMT family transporter [Myxococcota bacterium]
MTLLAAPSALESRRLAGLIYAGLGAFLFSLKGIVAKLMYAEGADVNQVLGLRMGFALPIYLVIGGWAWRRRLSRTGMTPPLLAAASLGVLSYYLCSWLDFQGLRFISVQLDRLILFLYPTFTAFLAWWFLGDRLTGRHILSLSMSYAGVLLLFGRELEASGHQAIVGGLLVLGAALLYAVYVTLSKPTISRLGSPIFTSVAMAAASVAMLTHVGVAVNLGAPSPPMTPSILGYGAVLAVACTVAPSFLITAGIARVGPGLASATGSLGPTLTSVLAVGILGEAFSTHHLLALVLTTIGVAVLSPATRSPPPSPSGGRMEISHE